MKRFCMACCLLLRHHSPKEREATTMKFTWFHLMPWPHMPDDFRQKHRSVWVDLPNRMYEPELGHIAYHQYLDQLEYAEQWVRRHRRERASRQRLWPDAVAQHHGGDL
jgi:SOS response regulatory protein OraA/RecX